jgi:hypothetical protein
MFLNYFIYVINQGTYSFIEFAIASAAIAIACAALSLIAIWLFGIYFQVRKRTKKTICFLVCLILLVLLICKYMKGFRFK